MTRRDLLFGTLAAPLLAAGPKPNILLIFADDMGWRDAGYTGSDFYETPHIDALAKQGMVFTQAYACGANCAPSRACLISGQYTPRHGIYAVGSTDRGPEKLMRMIPVPNTGNLDPKQITIAEALKAAGYATGKFGKWHLGEKDGCEAAKQGFDVDIDPRRGDPNRARNEPDDPKSIFTITRAACDFIEQNRSRPFFAYVAHHAIHVAQEARPATLASFKQKPPGKQHRNPLYAACVYDLDEGVGILLRKLASLGLEKNTLVVFTSDNGGTPQSSQEPLRGAKGCYYEGGIREPMIVRWPGVTRAGAQCDIPVANVDFYPTFVAAAGGAVPAGKILDGESLLPLFKGERSLSRSSLFWHFPGYLDSPVPRGRDPVFRTRPVSVIRKGDWKLHLYHEEWQLDGGREKLASNKAVELYNIRTDIGERNDLLSANPSKRDELLDELLAWIVKVKAPLPAKANPNYSPETKRTRI
ncbi:MAG TPA: sulfatase [Bryobacteraceae bacterium]|nr:sulfatase [Bryobacteraceae bacterium]